MTLPTGKTYPDFAEMGRWYANKVVEGAIPVCEFEFLACRRFLNMLIEAKKPHSDYFFSPDHVMDICSFLEKLPHVKGFDGTFVLEPVQCWWLSAIFGFRDRETGLRWVRQVSLYVPRKNGKSALLSGVAIFCANCENEVGAEVLISAGSQDQAKRVYGPIREMLDADENLRIVWKARDTREQTTFEKTGGYIQPVATIAKNLDGYNPHVIIAEELHAQKQEVFGVLTTAQGARRQPLICSISTAGRNAEGPAWDDWTMCIGVLRGKLRADRFFCAIYHPDKRDEGRHFDLDTIEKVNPLFGVSLQTPALEKEMSDALKSESMLQEFKRTRLNIWSRAAGNLVAVDNWDARGTAKLDLDALKGYPMYVGIDLANREDLNAAVFAVKVDGKLYFTSKFWIPRNCGRMKDDRYADSFMAWARQGWLTLTDAHEGTYIDQGVVLRDVLDLVSGHNVVGFGVDDYQANLLASAIEGKGHTVFIVRKNARNLTPATNDIVARVNAPDLMEHDGNPIASWCAGNVVGFYDSNDNVLPKKEKKGSRASIDGFDALVLANAICLEDEAGTLGLDEKTKLLPNPYLTRGLIGSRNASNSA